MSHNQNTELLEQIVDELNESVQYIIILSKPRGGNVKRFGTQAEAQKYLSECDDRYLKGALITAFVDGVPAYREMVKDYLGAAKELQNAEQHVDHAIERFAWIELEARKEG